MTVIKGIFTSPGVPHADMKTFMALALVFPILIIKEIANEYQWNIHVSGSRHWIVRHLYIAAMTALIILFGILGSDQFIYFQF